MSRDKAYEAAEKAYWSAYERDHDDDKGAIRGAVDAFLEASGIDPTKPLYQSRGCRHIAFCDSVVEVGKEDI